jgi:hypothetical protein
MGAAGGGSTGPSLFVYPQSFGGVPDAKVFYNGAMTNGSPALTDTTDSPFSSADCHSGAGCTGTTDKLICVGGISGVYGPANSGAFGPVPQSELCGTIRVSTVHHRWD